MGNPGNPAGLHVPAFNSSFAFFLVFMGTYTAALDLSIVNANVG